MSLRTLGAIVGTIGAGMSGYARGKRDYESDQAFKEDRDFQRGQRARMVKYQGEEDTLRDSLKAAGSSGKSPAEVARAQSTAYTQAGKPIEAQQLADFADRMEKEGALTFIDANLQGLGEPGQEFSLKGLDEFNAAGKIKAPPGARGRSTRIKLPNGMEINDFEVLDANGKVVLPSARRVEALYGYSRAERAKQERDDFSHGQQAEDRRLTREEQGRHNKETESTAARNAATAEAAQRATADYHARMAGVAEGKVGATPEPQPVTPESTFDRKTAAEIASATVKKEAEEAAMSGQKLTGPQMAARVDEIVNAMFQQHQNRFVQTQVQRTLAMAQNDPAIYAQEYGKALKVVPQQVLAQWGFQPPAAPAQPRPTPTAPAAPAAPAPAAPAPRAAMAPQGGDRVLAGIEQQHMAQLASLVQAFVQAKQQLAAAGKSGDARAVAFYSQRAQQANEVLREKAAQLLGNNADRFLATVP